MSHEGKTVTCKNRLTGEMTEVPAEKLRFRPSAYGVIIRDGKVLLNTAWDGHDFPGGGIDLGESIHDALVREVKEETGISVKVGPLLYVGEDYFTANFVPDTYFHSLLYYFVCTDPEGELSTDGFAPYEKQYMKEPIWAPLDTIDTMKFYNPVDGPGLIRMAAAGQGYTIPL